MRIGKVGPAKMKPVYTWMSEAPAIATGGLADLVAPHAETIERVDPFLTLEGLRLVWSLNA